MASKKVPFQAGEKPPINFSMRVIATDLPVAHKDFKIKASIDFVPDFLPTTEYSKPNFNGYRVKEILQFVADDVITKVIEFIYYDRANENSKLDLGDRFVEAKVIYDERKKGLLTLSKKGVAKSEDMRKVKDIKEKEIKKIVTDFLNKKGRKPSTREKNVTNIRFEHFSPSALGVSVQTFVNGEKQLPPPGGRS